MSLPGDNMPNILAPVAFQQPDAQGRPVRTLDYERGGIGLSDPSQGLLVQDWRARLDGDAVKVAPFPYEVETTLFSDPGITELSLAFDQNMRPAIAYMVGAQAKLWWFDQVANAVVTTNLDADVRSPFLSMDDKRGPATTSNRNDILLFYIRGANLCYRQQRDRFDTERVLGPVASEALVITRAGMSRGLFMQVELSEIQ
jgi:hypothetical protein